MVGCILVLCLYCGVHGRLLCCPQPPLARLCPHALRRHWYLCVACLPPSPEPAGYNATGRQRTPPSTFPRYTVSRRPASKLASRLLVACVPGMHRGSSSHNGLVGRALAREWEAHSPQHAGPHTRLSQYWSIVLSCLVLSCLVWSSYLFLTMLRFIPHTTSY